MNKYVIHLDDQNYCDEFTILEEVPDGWIEVLSGLLPQVKGQKFDPVKMCWLNEYADWYKAPPKPALSKTEQRELDQDELLLDSVIGDQQILLLLESGGDRV